MGNTSAAGGEALRKPYTPFSPAITELTSMYLSLERLWTLEIECHQKIQGVLSSSLHTDNVFLVCPIYLVHFNNGSLSGL